VGEALLFPASVEALGASVAALAAGPLWLRDSVLRTLIGFFTLLAPAAMWNLLAGCAGLVSIGQQAYVGLGAYGLLYFADALGLNLFAAVLVAGLVGALVAVPTAALAFRLRGGYFAIGTWSSPRSTGWWSATSPPSSAAARA